MPTTRIIFGEYIPDAPEVETEGIIGLTECKDVIPVVGGYRTLPDWWQVSTGSTITDSTTVVGAYSAKSTQGTVDFVKDSSAGAWITRESLTTSAMTGQGVPQSVDGNNFADFTQYGEQVIKVEGDAGVSTTVGYPQVYTLSGSTAIAWSDLQSSFTAKTVCTLRDFVVVGSTNSAGDGHKPTRVRWSAFGDATDWDPSTQTQSDHRDLKTDLGQIQKLIGGDDAFVIGSRGTALMSYIGPPQLMRFDYIHPGIGTEHPQSWVRIGSYIYGYAYQGFVRLGPAKNDVHYFGGGRTDKTMIARLDSFGGAGRRIIGWHDQENYSIGFQYNDDGSGALMYSYVLDKWWELEGRASVSFMYSSDIYSRTAGALNRFATGYGWGASNVLYGHAHPSNQRSECTIGTGYIQLNKEGVAWIDRVYPLIDTSIELSNPRCRVMRIDNMGAAEFDDPDGTTDCAWNATDGYFAISPNDPTQFGMRAARFHKFRLQPSATDTERRGSFQWRGIDVVWQPAGKY